MRRCVELAKKAVGKTYPNPMVGAVIVHNGKIIGEGYHQKAGNPHAEINAIDSVQNKTLLKESSIYVSLEPCAHCLANELLTAVGLKSLSKNPSSDSAHFRMI